MARKIDDVFGASRWMLPEHAAALIDYEFEKTLVRQPTIEEDELTEFNRLIYDSVHRDYAVTVQYWVPIRRNLGEIRTVWGWVKKIDATHKQIKVVNDEDVEWIDVNRIVGVWKG
ncbi:MAG: YolD-like family protein [Brevibacillus sp.]|nr:YolD-like family protein [Brevibacillus sp.]